jgi:hypothetical protein
MCLSEDEPVHERVVQGILYRKIAERMMETTPKLLSTEGKKTLRAVAADLLQTYSSIRTDRIIGGKYV